MRTTRRKFLAGSAAVTMAGVGSRNAMSQQPTLNIAWIRQFAPAALVQKEAELLKAEGVNVNMIGFTRGLDGVIAMQKGDADLADCLLGYSLVGTALSQGIDLTMVSGSSLRLTAIVIAPKHVPSDALDTKNLAYTGSQPAELLRGKTVAGARGSQQEFLLRSFLKANGMTIEKDIKFVDLKSNTDQALALQQGSVDAAIMIEPTALQTRLDGYGTLLTFGYDAERITTLNAPLVFRTDFIKKNPELVQRIVNAHVKAIKFYGSDREAWAKDTAAVTLFNPNTINHLMNSKGLGLDPKYWDNVELSYMLPIKKIQTFARNLFEAGFLPKDVSDLIAQHADFSFLAKATGMSPEQLGA